jgi:hypothetical protein
VEALVVDQLITMGSPLNAQGVFYRNKAKEATAGSGPSIAAQYIRNWKNYWLDSDDISGNISAASANTQMTEVEWLGSVAYRSHDAYFENVDLWKYIGSDVTADIVRNARVNDVPIQESETASSSSDRGGPYCMDQVCLGDRLESLRGPNWGQVSLGFKYQKTPDDWFDVSGKVVEFSGGVLAFSAADSEKANKENFEKLASVHVACSFDRVAVGTPETSDLAISVEPRPDMDGGWQGFQVVHISKSYSLQPGQYPEWESLILSRYPHASTQTGRTVNRVVYSKGKSKPRLVIESEFPLPVAYPIRPESGDSNAMQAYKKQQREYMRQTRSRNSASTYTTFLYKHPMCPKPDVKL